MLNESAIKIPFSHSIQSIFHMPVNLTRKNIIFQPDSSRVIARYMYSNDQRSAHLIMRILALPEKQHRETVLDILRDYSKRHRSITRIFQKNFNKLVPILKHLNIDPASLSNAQKGLIGSYFTMEYSIEAAAFFNPSIMEDPDQSGLSTDEKRVILSFRATGEGHISSIVFRSGILDRQNNISIDAPGKMLESPEHVKNHIYEKASFMRKLEEMQNPDNAAYTMMAEKLPDTFTYEELKRYVEEVRAVLNNNTVALVLLNEIMWLASSHYEMAFSVDTAISERVIFPIAHTEMKGIEDA